MSMMIVERAFFQTRYLKVDARGVKISRDFGFARRIPFSEIDGILLSSTQRLSLFFGKECFTLHVRPDKKSHQLVMDTLVRSVQAVRPAPAEGGGAGGREFQHGSE
jgi:hypothetical protein